LQKGYREGGKFQQVPGGKSQDQGGGVLIDWEKKGKDLGPKIDSTWRNGKSIAQGAGTGWKERSDGKRGLSVKMQYRIGWVPTGKGGSRGGEKNGGLRPCAAYAPVGVDRHPWTPQRVGPTAMGTRGE